MYFAVTLVSRVSLHGTLGSHGAPTASTPCGLGSPDPWCSLAMLSCGFCWHCAKDPPSIIFLFGVPPTSGRFHHCWAVGEIVRGCRC